jgi:hypothetical protein
MTHPTSHADAEAVAARTAEEIARDLPRRGRQGQVARSS